METFVAEYINLRFEPFGMVECDDLTGEVTVERRDSRAPDIGDLLYSTSHDVGASKPAVFT